MRVTSIEEYAAGFGEEPGYLDFAAYGPPGQAVIAEQLALVERVRTARFGSLDHLWKADARLRAALAESIGFDDEQIVFQPNTSTGLMQVMFALTGPVLLSPAEFPSTTFATVRSAESLHAITPMWMRPDHGRVTPGTVREHLTAECAAVAVSLVDFRTGYLADLDGIRQVIGDRLLIVDAVQGFGVVDAPWGAADVVVSGGQKWMRAGWGTGFLAMGERAAERLTPVLSGMSAVDGPMPLDEVRTPRAGARGYSIAFPDPIAEAQLATAAEETERVGIDAIAGRIAGTVSAIIDLADEFAIPVVSPRAEGERAGIVVLEPDARDLTGLTASLFNHGITATSRAGTVRLSSHASTSRETLDMLRAAFVGHAASITV